MIVGSSVSLTVTLKVQAAVRPEASAVQRTLVAPIVKKDPEGGEQLTVTSEQLEVAIGVA